MNTTTHAKHIVRGQHDNLSAEYRQVALRLPACRMVRTAERYGIPPMPSTVHSVRGQHDNLSTEYRQVALRMPHGTVQFTDTCMTHEYHTGQQVGLRLPAYNPKLNAYSTFSGAK